MLSVLLNKLQHLFARSPLLVKVMIKMRNQANKVIAYSFAPNHDPDKNGEANLLSFVSKRLSTVIDVGANKGDWSTEVEKCAPNVQAVYMFEPGNIAFEQLEIRFANNPKFKPVNKGVSNVVGDFTFYEGPNGAEHSSFVEVESLPTFGKRKPVTTIDTFSKEMGIEQIDYLKIDVEGWDYNVIEGAEQMLAEKRILFLQFEYGENWRHSGNTLTSTIAFLKRHQYKVYSIRKTGIYSFDQEYYMEFFGYSNFLAIHTDSTPSIKSIIR